MPLSWENSNPAQSQLDNLQSTTLSISLAFPWIPEQKRSIFFVVVTKPGSICSWKKCRKQLLPLKRFAYTATVTVFFHSWNVFSRFSWWTLCFRSTIILQPKHVQWQATRYWPPQKNKKLWAGATCLHPIGLLEWHKQRFTRSPSKFCLPFEFLPDGLARKKINRSGQLPILHARFRE